MHSLFDLRGQVALEFVDELSPAVIAQRLTELGAKVDAIGVVAVDHPHVSLAIDRLRERGVPTFALISDLTAEARAAFIGQDSRKEGRTAAWMIARTARGRCLNDGGWKHLGLAPPAGLQSGLFDSDTGK